jgi:transposase
MLMFPETKVYLAIQPTDMRRSFDGLAMLVKQELGKDVFAGELFVFMGKRSDRVKILYWDRNGFCLWSKRLEKGMFRRPKIQGKVVKMSSHELMLLLEGIDLSHRQRLTSL